MAFEEITNYVEEQGGETRIYCANCGDPEGYEVEIRNEDGELLRTESIPPTGYSSPDMAMTNWQRVGDTLVCGDPRCLGAVADLSEETVEEILTNNATEESLSEEAVANMPAPVMGTEFDLDAMQTYEGSEG